MKLSRNLRVILLSSLLCSLAVPGALAPPVFAQTQEADIALRRGFRTGCSDGYMAGYRDSIDKLEKDLTRHADYSSADRAYNKEYGSFEDYRDGYQQGFESGYASGYDRKTFESTVPSDLKKRGIVSAAATVTPVNQASGPENTSTQNTVTTPTTTPAVDTAAVASNNATFIIPRDTELILELQNDINTEQNREGEKFTAKVVSPSEIAGATIEGRVAKLLKPGRIKRRSELLLSFDRIVLSDGRWSNFSGTLVEVIAVKGDNIS